MKKEDITKTVILTSIIVVLLFIVGLAQRDFNYAKKVYQVYLNGNKLGLIEDKNELYALINEEQKEIKDIYNVSNVYPPNGFVINEYNTYSEKLITAKEVYETIKDKEDFTLLGYTIKIKFNEDEKKDITLYVLDEEIFKEALINVVTAFIDSEEFYNYINNKQSRIDGVGEIIENLYFDETITIKPSYISVNEKIYTSAIELTQYLLFGSNKKTELYTVKKGDTITSISENKKLNPQEFLIANPKYKNENSILTIGDKVDVTLIDPILTLVESLYSITDEEQDYDKEEKYDITKSYTFNEVTQTGITGIERITKRTQIVNGEPNQGVEKISSVTIREAQKEIITRGGSRPIGQYVDNGLVWGWPTNKPYVITSSSKYRWGRMHNGIDISGTGLGSPIYAARNGIVVEVENSCPSMGYYGSPCGGGYGNSILINHNNGYYTIYAHLLQNIEVNVGDTVKRGQIIGYMGNSGSSTGTHLHYGVSEGMPGQGGSWIDPMRIYR